MTKGVYGRFGISGTGRIVKDNIRQELKWFDTNASTASNPNNFTDVINLNENITTGTGPSQRVGRKITIKSIHVRGSFQGEPEAVNDTLLRVMLVLDKQCNGVGVESDPVNHPPRLEVLQQDSILGFMDLSNIDRFQIIQDEFIKISPKNLIVAENGTPFQGSTPVEFFNWYKKCNIPIEYSSTTGAINEIKSNNIFLMIMGEYGSDAAQAMEYNIRTRIRFSDS